jgi:hypothetical protein
MATSPIPLAILFALLAGCQSSAGSDYTAVISGDYRAFASCFSGQPITVEESAGLEDRQEPAARRIVFNDPARRHIVVEVYSSGEQALLYEVAFTGTGENTTEIVGEPSNLAAPYWWPNQVAPAIARCSRRM